MTVLEARGYFVVLEDGPESVVKLQGQLGKPAEEAARCRVYLARHRDRIIEAMRTYGQDVGQRKCPGPPYGLAVLSKSGGACNSFWPLGRR